MQLIKMATSIARQTKQQWTQLEQSCSQLTEKLKIGYRAGFKEKHYPLPDRVYRFSKYDDVTLLKDYDSHLMVSYENMMFKKDVFDRTIGAVAKWYGRYVLKAPASETFHHVEPGSFLHHSIQTANLACKYVSLDTTLYVNLSNEVKDKYKVIYPFAAWLAGLIHDIGKTVTDFVVIALDEDLERLPNVKNWDPLRESLYDWCFNNKVKLYRVVYNPNRTHRAHESVIPLFLNKVLACIPDEFVSKAELARILAEIFNSQTPSPLRHHVKKADSKSCEIDSTHFGRIPIVSNEVRLFVNALQDYDAYYEGSPHKTSQYFYSNRGLHIEYPIGIKDIVLYIVEFLDSESLKITNCRDHHFWIDRLRSYGMLVPNFDSKLNIVSNYQQIQPYVYEIETLHGGKKQTKRVITLQNSELIKLHHNATKVPVRLCTSLGVELESDVKVAGDEDKKAGSTVKKEKLEKTKTSKPKSSKSKSKKANTTADTSGPISPTADEGVVERRLEASQQSKLETPNEMSKGLSNIAEIDALTTVETLVGRKPQGEIVPKHINSMSKVRDVLSDLDEEVAAEPKTKLEIPKELAEKRESNGGETQIDLSEDSPEPVKPEPSVNSSTPSNIKDIIRLQLEKRCDSDFLNFCAKEGWFVDDDASRLFLDFLFEAISTNEINVFDDTSMCALSRDGLMWYASFARPFIEIKCKGIDIEPHLLQPLCIEICEKFARKAGTEIFKETDDQLQLYFQPHIAKALLYYKAEQVIELVKQGAVRL